MKRILLGLALLGIVIGGGKALATKQVASPLAAVQSTTTTSPTTPTPSQTQPTNSLPAHLIIDSLGINAPIESVGMDAQGRMDVPKDADNVAWYNLGFKPGEKGSAVIAGHLDRVSGAPAVFYHLNDLQPGDIVKVQLQNDSVLQFRVINKKAYPSDTLPLEEIFNTQDKSRLNLITCNGTFNQQQKNYSNRLVVFTELVR